MLGDEEQRRPVVALRPVVRLDGAHAGADGGDALGRQAVMRDQIVADVGAEREDVGEAAQRLAFGLLERRHRPRAVAPGVDMMGPAPAPSYGRSRGNARRRWRGRLPAGRRCRYEGHAARRARARPRPPVRRACAATVSPRSTCSLLSGRPSPATMSRAAMPHLASRLMRGRMASTDTPSRSSAFARLAGAPDHERRSRGSPKTQVMATRSKRSASRTSILEATFIASMEASPRRRAASDQPVTCPVAHARRHRLITQRRRNARQYWRSGDATACNDQSMQETMPAFPTAPVTGRSAARDRSRADGSELLFFCPDVTDASTLKRVQQFMDFGYRVTVFGFRRERYNTAYQPPWPNIPLGFTSDARYWHRVRALLRAIPALFAHRDALARAAVFYARNIDQLLLALLARLIALSRAPVVYEVLDIPPILMRRGVGADAAARDRAAVPAPDQPAGAFLAGLPSQLLCRRPEISRRVVPARKQAAPLDLRHRRPPCGAPPSAAGPGWSAISA